MANYSTLNKSALNAGAITSLVFLSGAATFNAGATGIEFNNPAIIHSAETIFDGRVNALFSDGVLVSRRNVNLITQTFFNAEPTVHYVAKVNWNNSFEFDIQSQAIFQSNLDLQNDSSIAIYTDFVNAPPVTMEAFSNLEMVANRGDSAFITFDIAAVFEDVEPGIVNRRVIGDWFSEANLWLNPVHDKQLGFINQDAYTFWSIDSNWEVTNFLTGIFTNGGFISAGAKWLSEATKIIFSKGNSWNVSSEEHIQAWLHQLANGTWNNTSNITCNSLRTAYGELELESSIAWRNPKSWRVIQGKWLLKSDNNVISGIGTITYDGKINWFIEGYTNNFNGVRIKMANVGLDLESDIQITGVRTAFASMDMDGIAGSISAAAVLKLVDAPKSRIFYVPKENRYFAVTGASNDFEVQS